ncbi:glycosyltransferase [Demequina sp. NBRC 110053]|uniref:UDP-N-acetylglucosamine--N-acetylmuramyl- (pentapeptide) pyrophosphoryl-undecaprenol N-acetylglucosamine transferase n=1 Tax=Demequina sp. NBRC 110053 TaxID=1570342 RepID=UPI001F436161|nr:UDP-N-acetylglucosamine--N-acetylmuramyl-(pentapeptide) pyrophosphoryl-undecaprenol N-acetylglucosamine transferase [Demequina sp. NBRC 110053]
MASILLAGGGTAGHVNPLLATATELRTRGHVVAAVGTAEGLEKDLVPRAGVPLHTVPKVPLPRRPSGDLLRLPRNLRAAVAAASAAMTDSGAAAVVGFGGYVSTPAYLAARRAKLPIVVHEANARPGLANRLGARMTDRVAVTFPGTPLRGATVTGLPLRREIADLATVLADAEAGPEARAAARAVAGWASDAPTLLVTGGSLGAASVNAAVVAAVPDLVARGVHVWHLTGQGKGEDALRAQAELPERVRGLYRVEEYSHDMATALAAAGAVICRAGAATVSEVTALGIPAMYVPLPHGNGEQADNARPAAGAGAATIVADQDLTADAVRDGAERMLLDSHAAEAMRAATDAIAIRDGAARVADMVEAALDQDATAGSSS